MYEVLGNIVKSIRVESAQRLITMEENYIRMNHWMQQGKSNATKNTALS